MKGCFLKRMNHHNWLELDCHAQGYQALNNILQPIREKMLLLLNMRIHWQNGSQYFFSLNNVIGGLNAGIEKMMLNY